MDYGALQKYIKEPQTVEELRACFATSHLISATQPLLLVQRAQEELTQLLNSEAPGYEKVALTNELSLAPCDSQTQRKKEDGKRRTAELCVQGQNDLRVAAREKRKEGPLVKRAQDVIVNYPKLIKKPKAVPVEIKTIQKNCDDMTTGYDNASNQNLFTDKEILSLFEETPDNIGAYEPTRVIFLQGGSPSLVLKQHLKRISVDHPGYFSTAAESDLYNIDKQIYMRNIVRLKLKNNSSNKQIASVITNTSKAFISYSENLVDLSSDLFPEEFDKDSLKVSMANGLTTWSFPLLPQEEGFFLAFWDMEYHKDYRYASRSGYYSYPYYRQYFTLVLSVLRETLECLQM